MAVVWLFGCFVMLVLDAGGCDWSFGSGLVVLLLHDLSLYLVLMFRMFCVKAGFGWFMLCLCWFWSGVVGVCGLLCGLVATVGFRFGSGVCELFWVACVVIVVFAGFGLIVVGFVVVGCTFGFRLCGFGFLVVGVA